VVACSEACGNAIRHAAEASRAGFEVKAKADAEQVWLIVRDFGHWVDQSSSRDDAGGRGLTVMRALMNEVRIKQTVRGTFVHMVRALGGEGFAPGGAGYRN
jgi:anti-sigma regulatory factor (Ser/Thr protein kinase)